MAALLLGRSLSDVARDFDMPRATVQTWKSRQYSGPVAVVASGKKELIGDLILEYVANGLNMLNEQTKVMADAEWIRKQSAEQVGILHGIIADKITRILIGLAGGNANTGV